jgi:hypothetical protein
LQVLFAFTSLVGGSVQFNDRSPKMHSLFHQSYAHAANAERRERHRPEPVIRAIVRRVRAA